MKFNRVGKIISSHETRCNDRECAEHGCDYPFCSLYYIEFETEADAIIFSAGLRILGIDVKALK